MNEGTLSSAKVHKSSRYKWRNGVCSEASNRLFLQIQINKQTGHSGALILTQMEKGDVSTHSALTPPPSNSSVQVYFSMSEHPDGRTLAAFFFFFFPVWKVVSLQSTYHNNTASMTSLPSLLSGEEAFSLRFFRLRMSSCAENDGWQTGNTDVRSKFGRKTLHASLVTPPPPCLTSRPPCEEEASR